ncbi:hypothetical protein EBT16_01920, partial [bacterium]|nr:hypothetical protein [bacterium]
MVNVVPSNTPKIIVFNGPPRSGKDTAVEAVMNDELLVDFAPMHLKFAEPLKRAVHALIGQPDAELEQFSEVKDSYVDDFFGFTLGLVAIKRIEKFMTGLDLNSF